MVKMAILLLLFLLTAVLIYGCGEKQQIINNKENIITPPDKESTDAIINNGGADIMNNLKITSAAFKHNGDIPAKYTCQGDNISPPIKIENIPENAVTLALIADDPDAPRGVWVHWVMWNIPLTRLIEEDSVPDGAIQGVTDSGNNHYGGPCPPSGKHRYFFKVYALDTLLGIGEDSGKEELEKAMQGHILAKGELIGLYEKKR